MWKIGNHSRNKHQLDQRKKIEMELEESNKTISQIKFKLREQGAMNKT